MKNLNLIFFLLALAAALPLGAQNVDEGLVIYYPFEGNLTDSVSGETAENFGNLTFGEGRVGSGAVRYFNEDAYFVTPSGKLQVGPTEEGGTPGTYALFVNHRAAPLETERHNYIAQKNGCGLTDNNRGRVVLYRQNPADDDDADELISFISGRPLRSEYVLDVADTWVHIALTVEPDRREFAFYIDGAEVARDTFPGAAQAENSCGEYVIGHHLTFTNGNQTFDGLMDELRFYDRVLSEEEIMLLAQGATSSTRETVVAEGFAVSPNPVAAGQPLRLALGAGVFRPGAELRVSVGDLTGRRLLQRTLAATGLNVDLAHDLRPGVYVVSVSDGARVATARVLLR